MHTCTGEKDLGWNYGKTCNGNISGGIIRANSAWIHQSSTDYHRREDRENREKHTPFSFRSGNLQLWGSSWRHNGKSLCKWVLTEELLDRLTNNFSTTRHNGQTCSYNSNNNGKKCFLPPLLLGKSETRFKGKNSIHRVHKIHQDSSRVNRQNVFSVGKYLLPTASMYEYLL